MVRGISQSEGVGHGSFKITGSRRFVAMVSSSAVVVYRNVLLQFDIRLCGPECVSVTQTRASALITTCLKTFRFWCNHTVVTAALLCSGKATRSPVALGKGAHKGQLVEPSKQLSK